MADAGSRPNGWPQKCVDRPIKNTWATSEASCPAARAIHVQAIQGSCGPLAQSGGFAPAPPTGAGAPHPSRRLGPGWLPAVGNGRGGRKEPCTGSICLSFPSVRGPASVAAAAAFPWCITARTSGHGERPFRACASSASSYMARLVQRLTWPAWASEATLCIGSSTPDRIRPVATASYERAQKGGPCQITRAALKGLDFRPSICYTLGRL